MSERRPVRVADLADIPGEEGLCVEVGGRRIALFRVGDEVYAVDDICPHQGAPLSQGWVYEDRMAVECPLHAQTYDLRTGREVLGRGEVETFPVVVEADGTVTVLVPE